MSNEQHRPGAWTARLKLIAGTVLVVLVLVVIFKNSEPTVFDLIFWEAPPLPLFVLLLAAFLVGAGAGWVASHFLRRRKRA